MSREPVASSKRYAMVWRNGNTESFFLILRRPTPGIMSKMIRPAVQIRFSVKNDLLKIRETFRPFPDWEAL